MSFNCSDSSHPWKPDNKLDLVEYIRDYYSTGIEIFL